MTDEEEHQIIEHQQRQEDLLRKLLWRGAQLLGGGLFGVVSVLGVLYAVYNGISSDYKAEKTTQNETLQQIQVDVAVVKNTVAAIKDSAARVDGQIEALKRQVTELEASVGQLRRRQDRRQK